MERARPPASDKKQPRRLRRPAQNLRVYKVEMRAIKEVLASLGRPSRTSGSRRVKPRYRREQVELLLEVKRALHLDQLTHDVMGRTSGKRLATSLR